MTQAVLDASAVLALLNDEPGADRVAPHVAEGAISAVNAAEIIGKRVDAGLPEGGAIRALVPRDAAELVGRALLERLPGAPWKGGERRR